MILNCWTKSGALNFIKTLKLLELVGENMLAATNLVICINLALIVLVSEASYHRDDTYIRTKYT